jgi:hypothetical protein
MPLFSYGDILQSRERESDLDLCANDVLGAAAVKSQAKTPLWK